MRGSNQSPNQSEAASQQRASVQYWIKTVERTYWLEEPEESSEEFSYQGDAGLDFNITSLHSSKQSGPGVTSLRSSEDGIYGYERLNPGQQAYLVVAKYRTGDTFGSHETYTVAAIKSDRDQAEAVMRICERPNDGSAKLRPWDGYFESLLSAEVVPIEVQ
jgi:hypothetical protein